MTVYYPPVGFYFTLSFTGVSSSSDSAFQEVSGISAEMGTEEISEGGENRFKHKLPTGSRNGTLTMRRGLVTANSQLATWCDQTINSDLSTPITPQSISVTLMDENGAWLTAWNFVNAWPSRWSISDLNAEEGRIVVETIEFTYSYYTTANNNSN